MERYNGTYEAQIVNDQDEKIEVHPKKLSIGDTFKVKFYGQDRWQRDVWEIAHIVRNVPPDSDYQPYLDCKLMDILYIKLSYKPKKYYVVFTDPNSPIYPSDIRSTGWSVGLPDKPWMKSELRHIS